MYQRKLIRLIKKKLSLFMLITFNNRRNFIVIRNGSHVPKTVSNLSTCVCMITSISCLIFCLFPDRLQSHKNLSFYVLVFTTEKLQAIQEFWRGEKGAVPMSKKFAVNVIMLNITFDNDGRHSNWIHNTTSGIL